jgi:glycosyltransferase involved in cell wall biosynthesis
MRIILSVQSIKYPMTGIGRYTLEIANRISHFDDVNDMKYYDGLRIRSDIPMPSYITKNRNLLFSRMKRFIGKYTFFTDIYKRFLRMINRNTLNSLADYIYHGTNFYLPDYDGTKIVTIHDLSIITYPEFHPVERVNMLADEIRNSIKNADRIITDSLYVKNEIMEMFDIDRRIISVIHLSHGTQYHNIFNALSSTILNKYDLIYKRYVLFVGTIEPRKNIKTLLEAYSNINENIRQEYFLVIVGHSGWNNNDVISQMRIASDEGWLRYIGFIEEDDLPHIYAGAHLFVFPSFYEGFGLPVLEAMASGVPVVASDSSSIPEVCGDAAALCRPDDVIGFRDLITRGITDEKWREEAIELGLERATHFSWDKCAQETYEVYKSCSKISLPKNSS